MNYILSPDCKLVKGRSRSAIYDLRRTTIYLVPNTFVMHIVQNTINVEDLSEDEYCIMDYLLVHQYFLPSSGLTVSQLSTIELYPNYISNCVIQYNEDFPFKDMAIQLRKLGCEAITFVVNYVRNLREFFSNISYFYGSAGNISIHTSYNKSLLCKMKEEKNFADAISNIIIYDSPSSKTINCGKCTIAFSLMKLDNLMCDRSTFKLVIGRRFYNESLIFNNCLYKKLTIKKTGEITNCPMSLVSYGNVFSNPSYIDIVSSKKFQKCWYVNKDKIKECQDCELKYACLDCRYMVDGSFTLERPWWCDYPL